MVRRFEELANDELRDLFARGFDDPTELAELVEELQQRPGPDAFRLLWRVRGRWQELTGGEGAALNSEPKPEPESEPEVQPVEPPIVVDETPPPTIAAPSGSEAVMFGAMPERASVDAAEPTPDLELEAPKPIDPKSIDPDALESEAIDPDPDVAIPTSLEENAPAPDVTETPEEVAPEEEIYEERIGIEPGLLQRVHPALVENGFSLVHSLRVENLGDEALRNLTLRITTDPPFARPAEIELTMLGPGQAQHLGNRELELDGEFFRGLTERMGGAMVFEIETKTELVTKIVGRTRAEVELCPRSEWPGMAIYPEFLAAFVLPNEPAIQPVIGRAREFLAKWTSDPSFDGYQSGDSSRVLRMAAALYAGLQKTGVTYSNPPASFVESGQRVRLPHELLEHGMGTCLDLTLLYAALLEQVGLHPLLILVEGHAFVGFWLQDQFFADPVAEEPLLLLNHVELGEIALLDITSVASRPSIDFDQSQALALRHLRDPDQFQCAIDVARARKGQVLPLATLAAPLAGDADSGSIPAAKPSAAPGTEGLEEAERLRLAAQAHAEKERPQDRVDAWCRKLLDLTMRNRLLNFRPTQRTVPLLCPDAAKLEDALADGKRFQVLARPSELNRDAGIWQPGMARADQIAAIRELLMEQFDARQLRADLGGEQLEKCLITLYRDARTAIEEGGSSNLYLAIGFLEYRETPGSSEARLAPVLLLPVELRRSGVRGKVTLALGGDEPRVNVTLLEYLRRDHDLDVPGFDPLPQDDSGIDVPLLFHELREAIRGKAGWKVEPDTALGIFSFAKILIWKDLMDRRDELLANPLVRHLVEDFYEPWDDGVEFPELTRLDDDFPATDVLCPLSADSSQLGAILAAAKGKSFVLQGPPGTGKSQTITNLIAHCLGEGKRVLFVSQKMAALEVVHSRLQQVGLSEACLELHSAKAKKREVLEQLRQALHAEPVRGGEEWHAEAQSLDERRRDLNAYVRALHRRYPSGETPFDVLSRLTACDAAPAVKLAWYDVGATPEEQLLAARKCIRPLEESAEAVRLGPEHPFLFVGKGDYTLQWDRDAKESLPRVDQALEGLRTAASSFWGELGELGESGASWKTYAAWAELAEHLPSSPAGISRELLAHPAPHDLLKQAQPWLRVGRELVALAAELDQRYQESPLELPLEDLHRLARESRASWWLFKWLKRRKVRQGFQSIARFPREVSAEVAFADLRRVRELGELRREFGGFSSSAAAALGDAWRGEETDWDAIEQAIGWTAEFSDRLDALVRAAALGRETILGFCHGILFDSRFGNQAETERRLAAYLDAWDAGRTQRAALESFLDLDEGWDDPNADGDAVDRIRARIATWLSRWREIPEWCSWRRARAEAITRELECLVTGMESGTIPLAEAHSVFEHAYADAWYTAVSSADPILARFLGAEHSRNIDAFRRLDAAVLELAQAELRRHVVSGRGVKGNAPKSSELGKLQRELTKRSRHIAIRRLFKEIPRLINELKPCFLMSPLSVAQYLEASREPFDLLVFDEASQIPVWDAIGAIARAKQLVVVGDSKQLPPTSFFERASDDGQEDVVEDQESILDECLSSQFPAQTLNWHYRSRHESLIAFSNDRYYENRLVTFPSCEDRNLGVSYRYVPDGVYDRGKTRTNKIEAQALVADVVERLLDPARRHRSIGVVTFNQTQQMLVQDLLDAERRKHHEIEPAFAEDNPDAVFVKNLENVQGDERDVILFSVGYGPDKKGRVHTNFGPLNRDGGERRLNVAVTRAKREAVVFSSMRADQVPVDRTRKQGVLDLKRYLDYAERGADVFVRDLPEEQETASASLLEGEVREALEARGWQVEARVGCSGYRIDLAVLDPEAPGRYLLGVECDGAMYHAAATARDRDQLRQEVLAALGWRLHRVWSTDWWRDSEGQLAKIEEALQAAVEARREAERESDPVPEDESGEGDEAEAHESPTEWSQYAGVEYVPDSPEDDDEGDDEGEPEPDPEPEEDSVGTRYPVANLGRVRGKQDSFYTQPAFDKIGDVLRKLVATEAPIALSRVEKLVAGRWGFTRVMDKAQRRLQEVIGAQELIVEDDFGEPFLWPAGADPDAYRDFRLPAKSERTQRTVDEISTREFAAAALHFLEQFGGMNEPDLVREVGRVFAIPRITPNIRARIENSITRLRTTNRIDQTEEILYFVEPGEETAP